MVGDMQGDIRKAFDEAIGRIGGVHANMAVLSRLDALLKNYNSNLDEAERLMRSDGAIAASIVKISNSALYGGGDKCEELSASLQKVGFDQALKLVSLALSQQVFMRDLKAYGVSADDYWRYSYFSAIYMESQAQRLGLNASDAYLIGLLHCVGRVIINELLHVDEVEILWDRFVPPNLWEKTMVGFTNEIAGALLLQNWNFSEEVYGRVAKQSMKQEAAKDRLLTLLHYTRQLAVNLDDQDRLGRLCQPGAHLYLKLSGCSASEARSAIEEAKAQMEVVFRSLKEGAA